MEVDTEGGAPIQRPPIPPPLLEKGGIKRGRHQIEEPEHGVTMGSQSEEPATEERVESPSASFRDKLIAGLPSHQSQETSDDESPDDDYDTDDDTIEEGFEGPYVLHTKEEKMRNRKPWKQSVIIKLLGRSVSYTYLNNRLKQLWSIKSYYQIIDLDNGYYCVKFSNKADYNFALQGGPWIVAGHYLTVRKWRPGFCSDEAKIDTIAAWIRFPFMPLENYNSNTLKKLGNKVGRTIRVDSTTSIGTRGKFARLCVELDLTKPLESKVFVCGRWQRVEYEGLNMICFHCGRFGHNTSECSVTTDSSEGSTENNIQELIDHQSPKMKDYEEAKFGPWMIAKKTYQRCPSGKQNNPTNKSGNGDCKELRNPPTDPTVSNGINLGSRFAVLQDQEDLGRNSEVVTTTAEYIAISSGVASGSNDDASKSGKEQLKKKLQQAADVSNKGVKIGARKGANKGHQTGDNTVKTAQSQAGNSTGPRPLTNENALKGISNVTPRPNHTKNSISLPSTPLSYSTQPDGTPPKSSNAAGVGDETNLGIGVNGASREREEAFMDEDPRESAVDRDNTDILKKDVIMQV